ncbi:ABC transporter substrate-binding protein [Comamonas sp. w2-DMI]|uniref:ABC transporter substrate-binding protein n=1 Tax=Comamonas sp. w2-DMI TaxID=3126391 RepID=UPI0032E462CB
MKIIKYTVGAGFIAAAMSAGVSFAKDPAVPRIGFVAGAGGYPKMAVTNQAFFDGLADAGYKDGSTMQVVFRTAEGNMSLMPKLIQETLDEKVDYLVVSTSPGCIAAKKATTTVPVLCISVQDDPIKEGLTTTLTRGNGNLVGVHSYLADGISQQLGMLQKLKPGLQKLGVLFNPNNDTHKRLLADWDKVSKDQKIDVIPMPAAVPSDLAKAISDAKLEKADIAIGLLGADTYAMRKEIAEAAKLNGFPIAMDTPGGYTQMGGVATIGVDIVPLYRQGALEIMVPMLKGKTPSELPWIGPKQAAMKINNDVAKEFNISIAPK